MTYPDSLRGIAIIIIAGFITVYGIVGGISYFSGTIYSDDVVYPVNLKRKNVVYATARFATALDVERSLWLKVNDRSIEKKDMQFLVRIIDDKGEVHAEFEEDFRRGYLRNSSGKAQYYRLGAHSFPAGFSGYFQYVVKGGWIPSHDGILAVRNRQNSEVPYRYAIIMGVGVMMLILGIRQLPGNA